MSKVKISYAVEEQFRDEEYMERGEVTPPFITTEVDLQFLTREARELLLLAQAKGIDYRNLSIGHNKIPTGFKYAGNVMPGDVNGIEDLLEVFGTHMMCTEIGE